MGLLVSTLCYSLKTIEHQLIGRNIRETDYLHQLKEERGLSVCAKVEGKEGGGLIRTYDRRLWYMHVLLADGTHSIQYMDSVPYTFKLTILLSRKRKGLVVRKM